MDYSGSILSLLPPIIALVLVLITRRVLISLGIGILVGLLMYTQFNVLEGARELFAIVTGLFYADGAVNDWEFYIILFILLLGLMASFVTFSGGARAFGEWALTKVKTRRGAQLATACLGLIIFIDDYFNSLTVGQVNRPLTDRHRVSRAKLAYIVDSTAAPMCVVTPVSSWGAYIIGIIAGIIATYPVLSAEALPTFLMMIPANYYIIFAILLVFAVAFMKLDFGPMRKHEQLAISTGKVFDERKGELPGDESKAVVKQGRPIDMLLPIMTLIVATVFFMGYTGATGAAADGEPVTWLTILDYTDVALALLLAGVISVLVAMGLALTKKPTGKEFGQTAWAGIKSMLPAVYILIFAWTIVTIIGEIGTGDYLASVVEQYLNPTWLPLLLFLVAGFMAFATGTSWGTFALMLPIAGSIAAASGNPELLVPYLSAVVAGAIFGDHCSPISDTTVLSSTGAGCHHIDHVVTQLPYALIVAGVSGIGYFVLGLTSSIWIGLLAATLVFVIALYVLQNYVVKHYKDADTSIEA